MKKKLIDWFDLNVGEKEAYLCVCMVQSETEIKEKPSQGQSNYMANGQVS